MVESITAIARSCGAWLALLALAFQLSLSIGHIHEFGQGLSRAASLTRPSAIPGPAGGRSPADVPPVPAQDQCAICFGLAVSGTFILAAPIVVILIPVLGAVRLDMPAQIIDLPRRPFSPAQQRAPPSAAIPA